MIEHFPVWQRHLGGKKKKKKKKRNVAVEG